ncbi:PhoPQ-activated pathogenicity-related family protein [Siphonobacter aquaeclarae]|uniref:PhoPQ-activated pathogenicity-related protein n=1 Tax=Siphonobacter aquaeclarae TaxID=563176 RepID=A0A1G9MT68_9BACT|nr:PhoPQ-activated protein PqaA family protein [Siphonobacter aquaeclarae]SDL77409.1 PhoPQ-activated pathogenicity-related protein [Siphonobacter aquaeclarae]
MKSLIAKLLSAVVVVFFSFTVPQETTPETALESYLHNGDKSFAWEVKETISFPGGKAYDILLTSQQWREHTWRHQLTVIVPDENKHDGALLFITGGSVKEGQPNWSNTKKDDMIRALGMIALKNKAIVAQVRQTPNQPLYGDRTEDALISYTLHQFKNDGDYSWPLLFPMVKSAVRAMDAIQALGKETLHHDINRFVVSGASKRGWTTWLTGANDPRVAAIAPMVIDVLNMPVNLDYQMKAWNEYSPQIQDYVSLEIPQTVHSPKGDAITKMIDPYSYRQKLTMPKMIFMGTNDEYWTVDAIKHYYDQIPGKNLIHYVPNVGHNLGDKRQALEALSAFFGFTLNNRPYPACEWSVKTRKKKVKVSVKATADLLEEAIVWSASSRDMHFDKAKWEGRSLDVKGKDVVKVEEELPKMGFRAFYIDLKYKDPNGGTYVQSTRMFLTDKNELKLH